MIYLNEQIVAEFTNILHTLTGLLQYRVYRLKAGLNMYEFDLNDANTYDIIFVGNCYKATTGSTLSIDITDIVRSDAWIPTEDELYNSTDGVANSNKLVRGYFVYLPEDDAIKSFEVAKVYPYPHHLGNMQSEVFIDWSTELSGVTFPLQGRYTQNNIGKYRLTPRYPYIGTDNYRLILTSESGKDKSDSRGTFSGGLKGTINSIPFVSPSSNINYTLNNLYNNASRLDRKQITYRSWISGDGYFTARAIFWAVNFDSTNPDITTCTPVLAIVEDGESPVHIVTGLTASFTVTQEIAEANQAQKLALLFYPPNEYPVNSPDGVYIKFPDFSDYIGKVADFSLECYYDTDYNFFRSTACYLTFTLEGNEGLFTVADNEVVKIDFCPSRYYLQWQDRMGGFQSQPFNDKYTYSESIESETFVDYQGRKRMYNVGVTGKFKISTDWIAEELYPYYESIFVSPVLFLYDTVEDKRYSVLVTDSEYTEKTYQNQKKLINLTLNLELNKKQNMIY